MRVRLFLLVATMMLASCGGGGGAQNAASSAGPNAVTADNWLMPGNTFGFNRYVVTSDITPQNVTSLKKAWITQLADDGEQESAPIILNGTIYISTPHNNVLALDGTTGAVKWAFPYTPAYVLLYSVNRGVGVDNGKVFVGTQDCHVIALDANTGKPVWDVLGCQGKTGPTSQQNSWYSIAAYPYKGAVYLGTSGGDTGDISIVSAFDEATGKRLWDWHTVPVPGEPNFGTWPGNSWMHGGASVWAGMSFDPVANMLFVAPGNAGPNLTLYGRKGVDLYSDSVVALQLTSGKPKVAWYYQILQNDTHDSDPAMPPVLFTGKIDGQSRQLLAVGDKDGNFVILDRTNGRQVYRTSVSRQLDILGIPTLAGIRACPNHGGGVEWNGGSYDPNTNYFFVPSTQECALWKVLTTGPVTYIPGQTYSAGPLPKRQPATGLITAINVSNGKVAWQRAFPYPAQGGVTIMSSGVAFTSDDSGRIYALDPKTGKILWHDDTGSSIVDAISFYRINGQPYLVTVAGEAGNQHTPNLPKTQGSRVVAYSLNVSSTRTNGPENQPTPGPQASQRTESAAAPGSGGSAPYTLAQAASGATVYTQKCASCHGANLQGVSAPALTGAPFARSNLTLSQMRTIVTTQMPLTAPGSLSPSDYASVIAYILQYDCVAPSNGGKTPFPTHDMPQFSTTKLVGTTCPVKH